MSIYAASKHAVIGLTKSAAIEYAKKKIRVNAVCPAVIDTDMFRRAYEADPKKGEFANAMHPVGRIGKVEEIASAVLYLCSDGAAFTTGHSLAVDGGVTAFKAGFFSTHHSKPVEASLLATRKCQSTFVLPGAP
jgi:NAD(P)-dependent dehydrogenase (short-subunit alcohol dehydrogenase family)